MIRAKTISVGTKFVTGVNTFPGFSKNQKPQNRAGTFNLDEIYSLLK
jgi:hypothetical protein